MDNVVFRRLGGAMNAFGKEMNKGVWVAAVRQKAQSLDSRSFDWHQNAPEAVKNEMYARLWEETGKSSMQLPREQHLLVQKGCAQAVNTFFSAYYDRMAS
jgi:hypothetical protein